MGSFSPDFAYNMKSNVKDRSLYHKVFFSLYKSCAI